MLTIFTCVLSFLLLVLLIISLGFDPKTMKRLTSVILIVACTAGVLIYGYGFSQLRGNLAECVMRTVFSVFCMFFGRNEIGTISAVPLLGKPAMQCIIYFFHLLALYATASAVVSTIGKRLVRSLRLMLARRGDLHLIYGANDHTVSFGEKLKKEKTGFIIYVDGNSGVEFDERILHMGSMLFNSDDAKKPTAAFLKKIGMRPGKRRLTVYCLDDNASANLRYAENMKMVLNDAGILPEQTMLEIILEDGSAGELFQARDGRPGYGSVAAFERSELLARLMITNWPTYKTMQMDRKGRAKEDFEAIIVGFGATGRAVLRSLVMNGQFEGSNFHATVISDDFRMKAGSFFTRYKEMTETYNIEFIEDNIRSINAYDLIVPRFKHLNYVAICTGNEKENGEIAAELTNFLKSRGLHPPIVQLSSKGVGRMSEDTGLMTYVDMYTPDILCGMKLDELAMQINHCYHTGDDRTAAEQWKDCDYFSRLSCRAAADYMDAFLYACGTDRQTAAQEGVTPDGETFENLSKTEHKRWCAFHYANGYRAMTDEIFTSRAQKYLEQKQAGETPLRLGKDTAGRYHACLIPWDELDALSEKERAVTGNWTDYKKMDRDNVRMILSLPAAIGKDKGAESR